MEKAASIIEDIDPAEAADLYMKAVHILKDENRGRLALDTYYKVFVFLTKHSRHREAAEVREIILETSKQINKEHRSDSFIINKCYLSLVIVALYNRDYVDAKKLLQEFEMYEASAWFLLMPRCVVTLG